MGTAGLASATPPEGRPAPGGGKASGMKAVRCRGDKALSPRPGSVGALDTQATSIVGMTAAVNQRPGRLGGFLDMVLSLRFATWANRFI